MVKKIFKNDVFHDGFLVLLISGMMFFTGFFISAKLSFSDHKKQVERISDVLDECNKANESCVDLLYQINNFNNELISIIKYRNCIEENDK